MAKGLFLGRVAEDEVLEDGEVVGAGQHLAMRVLSVTARPTDFLLVVLKGLREVEMKDRADIRFVDTHTEGNRRHNDIAPALHEVILGCGADIICESGMVGSCAYACPLQASCDALCRMLEGDINNRRECFFGLEPLDQ